MAKRGLLDVNDGARRRVVYEKHHDKTVIRTEQDCAHIVEAAKIMSEQTPGKEFRHAAFIPDEVMNQAMIEGWFHDKEAWKRWANDPDNARFRTWNGRL